MINDTTNLQEGYGLGKQYSVQIMMYYPLIDKSYLDTFGKSHWQVVLAMIGRNVTWRDASTTMGLIISFQSYIQIHSFALSWKQTCAGHCQWQPYMDGTPLTMSNTLLVFQMYVFRAWQPHIGWQAAH